MMKVNLNSGKTLDAHEIKPDGYTVQLIDRNGDVMNRVGDTLIESIESV